MGVLERGRGRPFTLFAPGGEGEHLDHRMQYAADVPGTKVGFAYGTSGHGAKAIGRLRRQADRDAAEARAVAIECGATQAVGFSRGARAIVGALAQDPSLLERIVLVLPPGGRAAGAYSTWLASLPSARERPTADIFVIGQRGDRGHPARVAELWAAQLDAQLEILPSQAIRTDAGRVASLVAEFLS